MTAEAMGVDKLTQNMLIEGEEGALTEPSSGGVGEGSSEGGGVAVEGSPGRATPWHPREVVQENGRGLGCCGGLESCKAGLSRRSGGLGERFSQVTG